MTAYWDDEAKSVEKAVVLEFELTDGETATDLFVFDDLVAVRVTSGEFKFFTIPLVAGQVSLEIPFEVPEVDIITFEDTTNTTEAEET